MSACGDPSAPRRSMVTIPQGRSAAVILVPVCAALVVFYPVLQHTFFVDEFIDLFSLVNFGVVELLLSPHGGHLLFFSNIMYVPLYAVFGLWTPAYYAVALVTHLVNVGLLAVVIVRFTGSAGIALIAATLWGCAAVNLGAIGSFASYGELLCVTVVLCALCDLGSLHSPAQVITRSTIARWSPLLLAGCGTHVYGLVFAALFIPVALFVVEREARWRRLAISLALSIAAVILVYLAVSRMHTMVSGRRVPYGVEGIIAGLGKMSWSDMFILTHAIFVGAGYAVSSLILGPILYLRNGWFMPPFFELTRDGSFVVLCVFFVWAPAWIAMLRECPPARRRIAIAMVVLGVAHCAAISVRVVASNAGSAGVAPVDAWVINPIARATIRRYQYVASVLFLLATAVGASHRVLRSSRRYLVALTLFALVTAILDGISVHLDKTLFHPEAIVEGSLVRMATRIPPGATFYVDNGPAPMPFAPPPDDLFPGQAAIAILMFPQREVAGRPVYFVEHDRELLRELRSKAGTPMASFVIASDDVPPGAYYFGH